MVKVPFLDQEIKMLREGTHTLTKRQCLTLMMAQYDTCGLISPVKLPGTIIIQAVTGADFGQDDALPRDKTLDLANDMETAIAMSHIEFPHSTWVEEGSRDLTYSWLR